MFKNKSLDIPSPIVAGAKQSHGSCSFHESRKREQTTVKKKDIPLPIVTGAGLEAETEDSRGTEREQTTRAIYESRQREPYTRAQKKKSVFICKGADQRKASLQIKQTA